MCLRPPLGDSIRLWLWASGEGMASTPHGYRSPDCSMSLQKEKPTPSTPAVVHSPFTFSLKPLLLHFGLHFSMTLLLFGIQIVLALWQHRV